MGGPVKGKELVEFWMERHLEVKEGAHGGQRDGHEEAGEEEEEAASGAVDQEHGDDGGHQLDDADDDRRHLFVERAARSLEYRHLDSPAREDAVRSRQPEADGERNGRYREVDDGIDAAELLQQHQDHGDEQRFQYGAYKDESDKCCGQGKRNGGRARDDDDGDDGDDDGAPLSSSLGWMRCWWPSADDDDDDDLSVLARRRWNSPATSVCSPRSHCSERRASSSRPLERSQAGVSGMKTMAATRRTGEPARIQASTFHGTKAPMTYVTTMPSARKMAVKEPRAPRTRGDEHSPICVRRALGISCCCCCGCCCCCCCLAPTCCREQTRGYSQRSGPTAP